MTQSNRRYRAGQPKSDEECKVADWIESKLFRRDDFDPQQFEHSITLYRADLSWPLRHMLFHTPPVPAPFSPDQLQTALRDTCHAVGSVPAAFWFLVNIHDNCVTELEGCGGHSLLRDRLMRLYQVLEGCPAEEGGTSYVGLVGSKLDWVLLLEESTTFSISFFGAERVCSALRDRLSISNRHEST